MLSPAVNQTFNQNDHSLFITGGTIAPDTPCYIERQADQQLLQHLRNHQYCHILSTRQMGKSSLMVKTAKKLKEYHHNTVVIDLSAGGITYTDESKWYFNLVNQIKRQLNLSINLTEWWRDNQMLAPASLFELFIEQEVVSKTTTPITIFLDEIETTLALPFKADDFYTTLRAFYNKRALNPQYNKLTFVLIGVATANELIQDETRTPFNIGQAVKLTNFSTSEAAIFKKLLTGKASANIINQAFQRIMYWTGGHPYLTQKLFSKLESKLPLLSNIAQEIDILVEQSFIDPIAAKQESNISFVRSRFEQKGDKSAKGQIYSCLLQGRRITEDINNKNQIELKLCGLVTSNGNELSLANRLYQKIFNLEWVEQYLPQHNHQSTKKDNSGLAVLGIGALLFALFAGKK